MRNLCFPWVLVKVVAFGTLLIVKAARSCPCLKRTFVQKSVQNLMFLLGREWSPVTLLEGRR